MSRLLLGLAVALAACRAPVDAEGKPIEVGRYRLRTFPSGARVWIDGELKVESTPATLVLRAGTYRLRMQLQGAEAIEETIEIEAGRERDVTFKVPLPPPATLTVISDVEGAKVRVNGYTRGRTPLFDAETKPGPVDITVTTEDGRAKAVRGHLALSEQKRVEVFFDPIASTPPEPEPEPPRMSMPEPRGTLTLAFKPDGEVLTASGKSLGESPLRRSMKAGVHVLILRTKDGRYERRVRIEVEADKAAIYRFRLGPEDLVAK